MFKAEEQSVSDTDLGEAAHEDDEAGQVLAVVYGMHSASPGGQVIRLSGRDLYNPALPSLYSPRQRSTHANANST